MVPAVRVRSHCAFCGKPGSSIEDVFPKWLASVVPGLEQGDSFELRRAHGKSKTNLRYLGLTSRVACKTCNNEWMSQFEQTVKPLLTPAIQNTPTTWASVSDRTTVARWAFKTALMIDRSSRPDLWTTPDKDFRYLFTHQEPPPSVFIFLCHYAPKPSEEVFPAWAGNAWTSGQKLPTGEVFDGYRITFSVGHAIFRVYGYADRDREGFVLLPSLTVDDKPVEDAYRQLWPLKPEPHEWPPRGANFATSGLQILEPGPS